MFFSKMFSNGSHFKENNERDLRELAESKLPVVIFGGSSQAASIDEYLLQHSVSAVAFCESSYYYHPGKTLNGKPVYEYEKLSQIYDQCKIVLAASGKGIKNLIESSGGFVEKVYVFDIFTPYFTMTPEWINNHLGALEEIYSLLADDESRTVFLSYLESQAHCLTIPVPPLWQLWNSDQYFNDLYDPTRYEHNALIDCGAWIGDTAKEYLELVQATGRRGKVYCFEPDKENFRKLEDTANEISAAGLGDIECFPQAVGEQAGQTMFAAGSSSRSHCIAPSENPGEGIAVPIVAVDELLKDVAVSMIKMDLEGGEVPALRGMRRIISMQMPFLAVCVYHKIDDLIVIPRCIQELSVNSGNAYRFYLRHHSPTPTETVLYAVSR